MKQKEELIEENEGNETDGIGLIEIKKPGSGSEVLAKKKNRLFVNKQGKRAKEGLGIRYIEGWFIQKGNCVR